MPSPLPAPVATHRAPPSPRAPILTTRDFMRLFTRTQFDAVTANIARAMRDLDCLVVELNHDEGMLRTGPYPRVVQNRISWSSVGACGSSGLRLGSSVASARNRAVGANAAGPARSRLPNRAAIG